ncbi:MAG TPA: hypothetical protein EYH30_05945 [Anaerolineales bacterium]|nr:hypothetical protein [Anaerolineales bacterium]
MRRTETLLILGGLLIGLFLTGCAAPPEITPAPPPPTPAAVVGIAEGEEEVPPVQAAAARFPMPPLELEPLTVNSDNCVACHTDQEQLQELAVEPEEEEHLSEGEG